MYLYNKSDTSSTSPSSRFLTATTPPSDTLKRKRSFSEGIEDRKLQKLSDNLANDIARSLSVVDSTRTTTPSTSFSTPHHQHAFGLTELQQIPHFSLKYEQQLNQLAQQAGMTIDTYRHHFDQQGHSLQQAMAQLQNLIHHDAVTFDQIKLSLQSFLQITKQVTSDQYTLYLDIFPEWRSWDGFIQKMITYIQCIEDMEHLVTQPVKTSNDLQQYIKDLEHLVDTREKLYGELLVHNGLEWKALGFPVYSDLLNNVKQWFLRVCISLMDGLAFICSVLQNRDDAEQGEEMLEDILQGLEAIKSTLGFIGTTNKKVNAYFRTLATVCGQWVSEYLEHLNQQQTGSRMASLIKKTTPSTGSARTDLRLMQKMDLMVRLLDNLQVIQDLDAATHTDQQQQEEPYMNDDNIDDDDGAHLETITDMLVEITVRAIAVIETHRSRRGQDIKGATNIMNRSLQSSYIYMEESLLTFADKVVELSGREWIDGSKVQRLHMFLEDIESSLVET
ncbi:hypothetical protein BC941DRAFT_429350 [Chlamydoabsidia padenii]|nr:hypothetical protein BC941DRAFT_429350 [Chlamydoabsidia padenii]